ncbi:MAG: SUMF1/EgtB/PvdO family nonheme iron enzyme, partial [Victivallales bacterium]|nr:SUMF1/EgtB/PvdO family nonheme iron enzyme [Victivallales bacterium]
MDAEAVLKLDANNAEAKKLKKRAVNGRKLAQLSFPEILDLAQDFGVYTISPNDSLWLICKRYGLKVDDVRALNPNVDFNNLYIGQKIKLMDCNNVMPLRMIKVKAGRFQMGSPENEIGRNGDENQHWVTLTKDFWLGETEVTQGQWKAVMGNNPSYFKKGDDYPVENVSWYDAKDFCEKLNKKYSGKLPEGYVFSLPSEAQWEYTCRAGTTTALNNGNNLTKHNSLEISDLLNDLALSNVGWYGKANGNTHLVAQKNKNAWGFYDMHGNVSEWCHDLYGSYNGDAVDPKGPDVGLMPMHRGGGWATIARACRSATRLKLSSTDIGPDLGFRLALVHIQVKDALSKMQSTNQVASPVFVDKDKAKPSKQAEYYVPEEPVFVGVNIGGDNQAQSSFPDLLDLNGVPLKMIKVKAGKFLMGSPENELGRSDNEKQHWVTLTKDYWLGETEVTQRQWKAVMGEIPSNIKKGDDYPVGNVSWQEAMDFCEKLNKRFEKELPPDYKFSLPTEPEWEYACRAGTTTALNSGQNITSRLGRCPNLDVVAWYFAFSRWN